MALKMAQVAERAYRFELGDNKNYIKQNNWKASRAGLLSGDRLMLQLQAMEASFVEKDKRRQEVSLSCPLSQINPDALVNLRQTGSTEIAIPEWWFDLYYPGQYRRTLQSVRLTIPCITGPYRNVGAKLTLLDSAIRLTTNVDDNALIGVQIGRNTSISSSSAISDPGVFELRFDSPKNPPFKGAGAVSVWALELPANKRVFDYLTISDVILELGYTAEDDGLLRRHVEDNSNNPSEHVRILNLKHEFPTAFHKLTREDEAGPVELRLEKFQIIPYWLINSALVITQVDIALELKSGEIISMADIQENAEIILNGDPMSEWSDRFEGNDRVLMPVTFSTNPIELENESLTLALDVSLPDNLPLNDIVIRLTYSSSN